jgi:polysaccharide export outer membrane protein
MFDRQLKFSSAFSKAALFVFLLAAGAFGQTPDPHQAIEPALKTDPNYRIGVGDVLRVLVPKNQILSTDSVRVGNNGAIRLPMLDDEIPARCLTEAELSDRITERYKKYLLNPQVYVTVTQFNSNPVAVVGAVNAPGRFQLQRPVRVLELITYVNGVSTNAGSLVQIIRTANSQSCEADAAIEVTADDERIINLPLDELMKGNTEVNPFVHAGDIVRVTEADQAYIIGNVRAAKAISLRDPVTLSKAIAMAGGVTGDAEIKKIKIARQNSDTLIVNLKDINDRKAEDVLLKPDDIIEVPGPTGSKKLFKDILRTIVPTVTRGLPIPIL